MSEDDFLKRWSRRKREAADAAKSAPNVEPRASEAAPENSSALNEPGEPEAEFDPASLPPIDSITAVSDISAFLRAGVPADLTRAALRRVWTADPAIRDFVGLAENAWDFTDPNAMPGFGPLESTDEVRQMIANLVDKIGRTAEPAATASPSENAEIEQTLHDSNEITASEKAQAGSEGVAANSDRQHLAQALGDDSVLVQSNKEDVAMQRDDAEATGKSSLLSRRPQGSALPQ